MFVVVWGVVVSGGGVFGCLMKVSGLEGVVCLRTLYEHLVMHWIVVACCWYKCKHT